MSNEQAIMDAFVAKSLEIIDLKQANRELLEALRDLLNAHAVPSTSCQERPAYEKAIAAIAKAEGAPS